MQQEKPKIEGQLKSNLASRSLEKRNNGEYNSLHIQHPPNFIGGLDVPPDSDVHGD